MQRPFRPDLVMKICADLSTTIHPPSWCSSTVLEISKRTTYNAEPTNHRKTSQYETARTRRRLPCTTGNHRSQPAQLRRTLCAASRSAVAVEGESRLGTAATSRPLEGTRRDRRCRLPTPPRPGSKV